MESSGPQQSASGSENKDSRVAPTGRSEARDEMILCPHMGLPFDPETHYSFTSVGNHCHRVKPAASINFSHQQTYCLTDRYRICPVFQKSWNGELPAGLRVRTAVRQKKSRSPVGLIVLLIVILAGAASFTVLARYLPGLAAARPLATDTGGAIAALLPTSTPIPTRASTATTPVEVIIAAEPLPSVTPTATIQPTSTPEPTQTATPAPPTPGPLLETPFGTTEIYLVHQVRAGESWGVISHRYAVDIDVLKAINPLPSGQGLWENDLVVVPLNPADLDTLTPLLAIFIEQDTTVQALAIEFEVDRSRLRDLNGLGASDTIPAGRCIIFPAPPV